MPRYQASRRSAHPRVVDAGAVEARHRERLPARRTRGGARFTRCSRRLRPVHGRQMRTELAGARLATSACEQTRGETLSFPGDKAEANRGQAARWFSRRLAPRPGIASPSPVWAQVSWRRTVAAFSRPAGPRRAAFSRQPRAKFKWRRSCAPHSDSVPLPSRRGKNGGDCHGFLQRGAGRQAEIHVHVHGGSGALRQRCDAWICAAAPSGTAQT